MGRTKWGICWAGLKSRAKAKHTVQNTSESRIDTASSGSSPDEACRLLRGLMSALPEAVVLTRGDLVIYANAEFTRLFGYTMSEVLGRSVMEFLIPADRQQEVEMLMQLATHRGRVAVDTVRQDRDGVGIDVSIALSTFAEPGFDSGFVLSFRDIRGRKQSVAKMQHFALHDVLTSLPNRALFLDRLRLAMARRRRRHDLGCAVMFVDLDKFKGINDTHGHAAGDALLIEVARRLRSALRPQDTAARMSGDEFAILLENIQSADDVGIVAERILGGFRRAFELGGNLVSVGASIGMALCGEDHLVPEQLLRDADFAMYRAKQKGGLRCEIFDTQMQIHLNLKQERESELKYMLDRRDFAVWYQPYYRLQNGILEGFESLLRWKRQNGAYEPLREMLTMADGNGLSILLNRETIIEGCDQLEAWSHQQPDAQFILSMNLSARQLYHPELIALVGSVLDKVKVDPRRLMFEVSEAVLNETPDTALRVIERLSERGVRIAVDNFGAHLAPINQLVRFPIDTIKLDARLTALASDGARQSAVLDSIVRLGQSLGLQVIAQGVEEQRQVDILKEVGCDLAQGYLFAPAVEPSVATRMITQGGWLSGASSS